LSGSEAIEVVIEESVEPSEEDAFPTMLFVFALITAARDEVAIPTRESVLLFTLAVPAETALAIDEDAVVTSDWVASDPLESPAPVSVRVPLVHTSAASVPNVVRERVE